MGLCGRLVVWLTFRVQGRLSGRGWQGFSCGRLARVVTVGAEVSFVGAGGGPRRLGPGGTV